MRRRNSVVATGLAACFLAVGFAAAAFACTALATLGASSTSASAGSNLAITGAGFAAKAGTPVILHWNGANGPEVGRAVPDASGDISTNLTVPESTPGYYVLVATQAGEDGKPVYGTPARASLQVVGADGTAPAAPVAQPPAPIRPVSTSDGRGLLMLSLLIGAGGIVLLGAGLATSLRRRARPEGLLAGQD